MENLFTSLLQQSLTACWVILAVLILRFLLRKAPKGVTNLLWLVVAFRLLCPLTFESDISLVTQARTAAWAAAELMDELQELSVSEALPTVTQPEATLPAPVPAIPEDTAPAPTVPVVPGVIATPELPGTDVTVTVTPNVTEPTITVTDYRALFYSVGCALWLAGMAVMTLYGGFATRQWHKRVGTAVRGEDGIWRCETVETPFILGVLRPRIYLPYLLPEGAESYVIAHEQAHLRRHDPLLKCLAFVLLSIYWFHPLVWVSYFLFCRDIELACDQQVTRDMDAEGKKAYSRALLACTVAQADPILCPLSFGEVGVKARIQAVLGKKPGKALTFTAIVLCVFLILSCAADPKMEENAPALDPAVEEAFLKAMLQELTVQSPKPSPVRYSMLLDMDGTGQPELLVCRDASLSIYAYDAASGQAVERDCYFFESDCTLYLDESQALPRLICTRELNASHSGYTELVTYDPQDSTGAFLASRQKLALRANRPAILLDEEGTVEEYTALQAQWLEKAVPFEGDWMNIIADHARGLYDEQVLQLVRLRYLEELRAQEGLRYAAMVDFALDGIPELVYATDSQVFISLYNGYSAHRNSQYAHKIEGRFGQTAPAAFALNLGSAPARLTVFDCNERGESATSYYVSNGEIHWDSSSAYASGPITDLRQTDEYDYHTALVSSWLKGAQWIVPGEAGGAEELMAQLEAGTALALPMPTAAAATEAVALYRPVVEELITQYGCFYTTERSPDLILGLKYARLHDLNGDDNPELITLVNTRDSGLRLTMTLRVYGIRDGQAALLYETPLGERYRQTDVSYSFAFTEGMTHNQIITYHTSSEWYEEILHAARFYGVSEPDVHSYRALSTDEDAELEQFWEDGQEVTLGRYGEATDRLQAAASEIDACWDVSPAGRTEMEVFLTTLGLDQALLGQIAPAETAVPDFSVAEGMLYYQKRAYRLPNYRDWNASGSSAQQVGRHLLISAHINPDHSYYAIFNTETLAFDQAFYGQVLDWQGEDLTTLVYSQWNELYTFDGFSLDEFAQSVNPNELLVEEGHYAFDGSTFTVTYSDAALILQQETLPVPHRDILEAANLLNGRSVWRTGLLFCPTFNALPREEAQALAAELVSLYGPISQWPFDSCQVSRTQEGSVELTLLQPHEESRLCLASTFYLEPDGTIRQSEDRVTDGYAGMLLYEGDGYALIASRRSEGCPLGMEPCGYCFVTDLRLWNADRTENILLLEGAELAINFTVLEISGEKGILSIAYVTGPPHSEYNTRVFGDIDLNTGTYTETAREYIPI